MEEACCCHKTKKRDPEEYKDPSPEPDRGTDQGD